MKELVQPGQPNGAHAETQRGQREGAIEIFIDQEIVGVLARAVDERRNNLVESYRNQGFTKQPITEQELHDIAALGAIRRQLDQQ